MPDVDFHAWTHRPKALGGTDPIQIDTMLPSFRATQTTNFTVVDGAYYGLAQTEGADPSAFGIAELFEFFDDAGDGTGAFNVHATGTGEVLKLMAAPGGGDQVYALAYDAGVVFTTSIDTTVVTASLYLGTGVGSGLYSEEFSVLEAVMASNVSSTGTPTLRLSGTVFATGQYVDGVTGTDLGHRPTISPILLVEGGTPTVTESWCNFTAKAIFAA
jgi:hypothetical protein